MNKTIYDLLAKRNFNNYMIETISETVIDIYSTEDVEPFKAKVRLDFDNCMLTQPAAAEFTTFRYLLKIASVVIEAFNGDVSEWKVVS